MRLFQSLMLLLAIASTSFAQDEVKVSDVSVLSGIKSPKVIGDYLILDPLSNPKQVQGRMVDILVDASIVKIKVESSGQKLEAIKLEDKKYLIPSINAMKINVFCLDFDKKIYIDKDFELAGPKPPGPQPEPQPDNPPAPVPDKIDNLSVLMVYESGKLSAYTEAQRNALNSTVLRTWMDNNVPKDAQGLANWRVLDKDTKFPTSSDLVYKKWLQTPPSNLPYLIIGNKDTIVYQGELPTDLEQIKAIITKYRK